ncbi:MAG: hypothetical protein AB7J32_14275 [Pseudonocardia sp.]
MPDLDLLPAGKAVTLTGEEHHQHVLAAYAPFPREVVVELGWCRIASGKYAGQRGVEALLGGRRIGELTFRMSERYAPVISDALARGARPGCVAVLRAEERGIQAELRLPAADATTGRAVPRPRRPAGADVPAPRAPEGVPPAPRSGTGTAMLPPAAAGPVLPPPATAGPVLPPPAAAGPVLPPPAAAAWTGPQPEAPGRGETPWPPAGGWPADAFPEVVSPTPAPAPRKRRRGLPVVVAASVIGLFTLIGIGSLNGDPAVPTRTDAAERRGAAPAPDGNGPSAAPSIGTASAPLAPAAAPSTTKPAPSAVRADPPTGTSRTAAAAPTTRRSTAPTSKAPTSKAPTSRAPTSKPAPVAGSGCHPNYAGACVPIASDVDCAGGSGNGPAYVRGPVRIIGEDVYGLDRDGDGTACE